MGPVGNTTDIPHVTATNTTIEDEVVWIPFVEPVPDWEHARETWGVWWTIHIYSVGIIFFLISIYTIVSLIFLIRYSRMKHRHYFIALNVIVFIFAFERGLFMFVDAYNANGRLPNSVAYLFLSLGLPCMTSAFYLIFQAYLRVTRVRAVGAIHKPRTLVVIIAAHFVVSIALDLAAGFTLHALYLLIMCQVVFIVWGLVISTLYFYLYRRIYQATVTSRKYLWRVSQHPTGQQGHVVAAKAQSNTSSTSQYMPRPRVVFGAKVTLVIAIVLFIISWLYLGGIFGCYTLQMLTGKSPEPWPWWGYELSLRLCEIILCSLICLTATQPVNKKFASSIKRSRAASKSSLGSLNKNPKGTIGKEIP